MKRTLYRLRTFRNNSFTLVELLVVIGIITILAAFTLSVSSSVINAARRAKAANTATQIQTAVLGYYTEYSVYPNPTPSTSGDSILDDTRVNSGSAWGVLIGALCGNINPASPGTAYTTTAVTNSRGIAFLSLKASDVDTNSSWLNAPVNPANASGTNYYFNIAIDTDYDGLLGTVGNTYQKMPNFSTSTMGNILYTGTSTAGVAVWENCNPASGKNNPNYWVHTY